MCLFLRPQINCTNSLHEFLDAFAHKDPCQVPDDAYDEFLNKNMVHSEPNEVPTLIYLLVKLSLMFACRYFLILSSYSIQC